MGRRLIPRRSTESRGRRQVGGREARRRGEIVGLGPVAETTVYPHVFGNADREVGGVLIGRTSADGGLPLITGAIPAISADERRATLTFTQDAWAHVHRTLDSDFPPDEQIVGWYHSHPGFGIFLSGHDLFIHQNFFGEPSQIAVVVDPVACTEGAFVWKDEEVVGLFERATPNRWLASGALATPVAAESRRNGVTGDDPQAPRYPILALTIAAMIGVLVGFGAWSVFAGETSSPQDVRTVTLSTVPARPHGQRSGSTAHSNSVQAVPENGVEKREPYEP